jgi:NAD(P)-dependent dehydrogenase (short-subunit alcohol dehydrogenase family)
MKTALVTGAAQGLGLVTATLLSQQGYCVILTTRDHGALDALVNNAGIIHRSAYNASKHGLIGLTKTLAAEWGGRGIRVNAVCPGWIKTEMDAADQGSGAYSDVAEAIAFLCDSRRCSFINGVTLPVDGGWTADGSWDNLRLRTRPDNNPNPEL